MPIFRYTFKKMIATPSTWIIFIITLIFLALSWSLISLFVGSEAIKQLTYDQALNFYVPQWKILSFSVLLSIMIFVFISVKATQVFRDEIDDGTLLILVSKPVSRTRIWTEKLLSLQVVIILYLFLSIFIASFVITIPGIGSSTIYSAVFPYLWILFGVAIIFDLIISSIAILFSLILNAKALVAIMIGMAALFNIFATLINGLVTFDPTYYVVSQSLAVYNNVKAKLDKTDIDWINDVYRKDPTTTIESIHKAMVSIYDAYIKEVKYPNNYDYQKEQTTVLAIKNGSTSTPPTADAPKDLVTHIYNIGNAFRQWKEQSFEELMTGEKVGLDNLGPKRSNGVGSNNVDYSVNLMITGLNTSLSQSQYDALNTKTSQVKAMRYLNIFYQLKYIWDGISTEQSSIFAYPSEYAMTADSYLVSFNKVNTNYQVDTNKATNSKILNFPVLLTVYVLLGIGLLSASWLVFNRRDFT
ncbi:ABC transporter permease [Spiroplasma endosymbiont of Amphimallon solstitiale]|uniref:ABC transporter permease n=1 Tax=Spiroplasma endosymbiont of Amphimallon solstitiale TaxID=3066288 RepID=UPI00313D0FE8